MAREWPLGKNVSELRVQIPPAPYGSGGAAALGCRGRRKVLPAQIDVPMVGEVGEAVKTRRKEPGGGIWPASAN
jgi:hypothetical protein